MIVVLQWLNSNKSLPRFKVLIPYFECCDAGTGYLCFIYELGAFHKKRPQSGGEGVCPVRTFFGQGGSSDADVRNFLRKQHRICLNLWCVRTYRGG